MPMHGSRRGMHKSPVKEKAPGGGAVRWVCPKCGMCFATAPGVGRAQPLCRVCGTRLVRNRRMAQRDDPKSPFRPES